MDRFLTTDDFIREAEGLGRLLGTRLKKEPLEAINIGSSSEAVEVLRRIQALDAYTSSVYFSAFMRTYFEAVSGYGSNIIYGRTGCAADPIMPKPLGSVPTEDIIIDLDDPNPITPRDNIGPIDITKVID